MISTLAGRPTSVSRYEQPDQQGIETYGFGYRAYGIAARRYEQPDQVQRLPTQRRATPGVGPGPAQPGRPLWLDGAGAGLAA